MVDSAASRLTEFGSDSPYVVQARDRLRRGQKPEKPRNVTPFQVGERRRLESFRRDPGHEPDVWPHVDGGLPAPPARDVQPAAAVDVHPRRAGHLHEDVFLEVERGAVRRQLVVIDFAASPVAGQQCVAILLGPARFLDEQAAGPAAPGSSARTNPAATKRRPNAATRFTMNRSFKEWIGVAKFQSPVHRTRDDLTRGLNRRPARPFDTTTLSGSATGGVTIATAGNTTHKLIGRCDARVDIRPAVKASVERPCSGRRGTPDRRCRQWRGRRFCCRRKWPGREPRWTGRTSAGAPRQPPAG